MREIKFRAWDREVGKWKGIWIFRGGHIGEKSHYDEPEVFRLDDRDGDEVIFMQYTGLKDKDGKEIYEGDIVDCQPWSHIKPQRDVVEYSECQFFPMSTLGKETDWGVIGRDYEVVGNIYENPDLLNNK
jgi:uncharacterized phage protein (TIGR01671 family)